MSTPFIWPVDKVYITQGFGLNPQMYAKYGWKGHNGLDFRVRFADSPLGRRYIMAVADGIVEVTRADAGGYGTHIRIRHRDGSMTIYGHLTKSYVSQKQLVKQGERIGLSGNTGASTGAHLHWEYRPPGWERKTRNGYGGAIDAIGMFPPIPK